MLVSSEAPKRSEFVAHPRDSDDQFRALSILLQFLAEAANMDIHRTCERSAVIIPDRAQEFVARDRASGSFNEMAKKLKFQLCETDRVAVSCHLPSPDVGSERAKFMNVLTQDTAQFYDDRHAPFWLRFTEGFEAEFSPYLRPRL